MKRAAFLAGALLLFSSVVRADPCQHPGHHDIFPLASVSEAKSYGLLLIAPIKGCARVRYRVETASARFLGHTPALAPGEMFVLRLGRGFAEGLTLLRIVPVGCVSPPALVRRVTLAKPSPDHGARAASVGS